MNAIRKCKNFKRQDVEREQEEILAIAEDIYNALSVAGPAPEYHYRQLTRLKDSMPILYRHLMRLKDHKETEHWFDIHIPGDDCALHD